MARRTSEEILAQRDAWMARKAAREAGEDVPLMPPLKPGEEPPELETPEVEPEADGQPASEAEPEPAQPVAEAAAAMPPEKPTGKRTPEEIRVQREAFMAARAAKAAGLVAAAEEKAEAPAPAPTPAAAPAQPAAKPAAPKPAPKPKPKPAPAAAPAPDEPAGPVTRREFLNYAWLASIALFTVETVGLSLWFAFPNFREGEFGGEFRIGQAGEVLPEVNVGPKAFTEGKFWLVNVDKEVNGEPRTGVLAIFKVCTHLGCLYDWVDVTERFECPCHGSKFQLTGDYIEGPARRSLDRFVIRAYAPDDVNHTNPLAVTNENGDPLVVNEDHVLVVDTGARILGTSDITIA